MKGPLALPIPQLPPCYAGFIQGLQSMFFVAQGADGDEYVVEDQEVNGGDLVDYVAESLERLRLTPITDPRSFWLSEG